MKSLSTDELINKSNKFHCVKKYGKIEVNVLFNEYLKPQNHEQWQEAMAVNGVTPEFLK